jgi:poly(beta-D-mannuronate) lyase
MYLIMAIVIVAAGLIVGAFPQILYLPAAKPPVSVDVTEPKRHISVSSLASLGDAIDQAVPGDQITLQDGIYATHEQIRISAKGTPEDPIVIAAQTVGSAEITGSHGIYLDGSESVVIRGFKFTHSQDTTEDANRCDNCIDVRFTSNTFELTTQSGNASDWLAITGSSSGVRIDNNIFRNKSTMGNFVILVGEEGRMVQNTLVDHNVFSFHTFSGSNGGECVEVGNTSLGPVAAYTIIEHNLFDNCNGDSEALSIKSSNNIIRYNTFKNSYGSLVLRHGSDNIVDGNVFLEGNNGIRAYGSNQVITNNYLGRTTGIPIVVGRATVPDDLAASNAEYSQSRNIVVAHNTLVGNEAGIVVGAYTGSLMPQNVTVANNIVTGDRGILVQVIDADVIFANNIVFPTGYAAIGDIPEEGYLNIDPLLEISGDIMRPASDSPAVDAVAQSEAYGVVTDIKGQARIDPFDIGAYELS